MFSSISSYADITNDRIFTLTKRDIKQIFDVRILSSETNAKNVCYNVYLSRTNPNHTRVKYAPLSTLSKIDANFESSKVHTIDGSCLISQNGNRYYEFRYGDLFEHVKVLKVCPGHEYIKTLDCDLTQL